LFKVFSTTEGIESPCEVPQVARIAVVDDNHSARLFAAACLRQSGHEVQELDPSCLFEILRALHEQPVDLLVTDLVMPHCPGMSLIRACREDVHLKELKILLLTAFGDLKLARFLQTQGNVHYLSKPVAPQALTDCVNLYLQGDLNVDLGWSLDCQGVVAVVDDSQLSRRYHAACLRKSGYRPMEVPPGDLSAVVNTLKEAPPEVLLLDFLMPSFRGDALIRALRASETPALRDLPILLVTAHTPDGALGYSLQGLRVEVFPKPVTPETLSSKVRELILARRGS